MLLILKFQFQLSVVTLAAVECQISCKARGATIASTVKT